MAELFGQLGIDLRLLTAQAVNFLIVLAVLYVALYRPLVEIIRKRTERIAEGLAHADRADELLAEADALKEKKLREAEVAAVALMQERERVSEVHAERRVAETDTQISALMSRAAERIRRDHAEAMQAFDGEAVQLVKAAVVKYAELSPAAVDEQLVGEAVRTLQRESSTI